MKWNTKTWSLLSLILFLASAYFWHLGNKYQSSTSAPALTNVPPAVLSTNISAKFGNRLLTPGAINLNPVPAVSNQTIAAAPSLTNGYRLSNSSKPIDQLARSDAAILLRNAFIETTSQTPLEIPEHLHSKTDPGSYIVQSRGSLDDNFRALLKAAGATIISYIPNNAYLVRVDSTGANQLAGHPRTQAILPYEPYYKLDERLLSLAVEQKLMPEGARLNVTLFPGERGAALDSIQALGAELLGEDRSPFGPQIIVQAKPESLVALAKLTSVQAIETYAPRVLLNDRTRIRLGVTTDTTSSTNNYLGLTGDGVLVNVNDTGVDATHPGLAGRVTSTDANTLTDPDGHGTHVAGTIAGSGAQSSTVTNASGSVANANFRGMAPAARLFVLPVDLTFGPLISDSYLQETAARTNPSPDKPLISNNGWGYQGVVGYNSSAASYDAAVRDALPGSTGSQPMIYVFAAGDSGFGFDTGEGGLPGTVISPATAKNVISVGAIESARGLTNEIAVTNIVTDDLGMTVTNVSTNQLFFGATDSDNQVTSFSSRGNVAPGLEGSFGRFKPDVVAPGSFIVSARSKDWTDPTAFEDVQLSTLSDQVVAAGSSKTDLIFVPENARELLIRLVPNASSASPFPLLPILVNLGSVPDTNTVDLRGTNQVVIPSGNFSLNPGFWFFQVVNPGPQTAFYDLQTVLTTTNGSPEYFEALKAENDGLGPSYRYESGTSMSAAAVSGVLALMQEFFDRNNLTYSPALMKALLINGARSAGPLYSFQVGGLINQQGWGVVNVTNSIPAALQTGDNPASPVRYVDQSITNSLATGETRSWDLALSTNAQQFPLRITLVWTDPPGNPGAALKLVNDLDLVVENLDVDGQIFYGNNIPVGSDFTTPSATNSPPVNDFVNNVENVYLNRPIGSNYSITVTARRVNVNALPQHPDGIVQDFALVVSSDNSTLMNAVTLTPKAPVPLLSPPVTTVTNGVPFLHERVGANSPLLGGTNGTPSQWNFYVFTNDFSATNAVAITNGTNVAFLTFLPPNVSRPRNIDADVDLYVSRGVPLTNLNLSGAVSKSTKRGGSELVFFTNSFDKEVFYVGVKAEDQQGGEYGLVGLSSAVPFSEEQNGNLVVHGLPFNVQVADGTPDAPGGALIFGIATRPIQVQRAVVNMSVRHESIGDLLGNLSHNGRFAVLNNHFLPSGPPPLDNQYSFTYDDSNQGDNLGRFTPGPSDGPGSLNDFIGEDGSGAWQLTMVDNTPSGIGQVESFDMILVPSPDPNNIIGSVLAEQFVYYFIDVPADATNLTAALSSITPSAPLELYLRLEDFPDFSNYDKFAKINPPGGSLTITPGDIPPLNAGRYFVGVYNPNTFLVNFRLRFLIGRGVVSSAGGAFSSERAVAVLDDAVSRSTITVPTDGIIAEAKVGVRIDHPRVSDLALHLTSPQGSRVLLAENRGGITAANFGEGNSESGITYTGFTENTNLAVGLMKFVSPPYSTNITVKTNLVGGFEGIAARVYPAGQTVDGWDVLTNRVTVVTSGLAHSGTNFLDLGRGHITRALPTTAGKQYDLKFAYRAKDPETINVQLYVDGVLRRFLTGSSSEWKISSYTFIAPQDASTVEIRPLFSNPGMLLDTFELVESGGAIYYQPEESLDILKGERSVGDWTLEVWDSRGQFAGNLLNWQLQLTFANPSQSAVTLTNGLCYLGTVANNDIAYFIVEVPRAATIATNTVTGTGDFVLLFNQNGAPTGATNDFAVDINGPDGGEFMLLSTNGNRLLDTTGLVSSSAATPFLLPGQRYYLGVVNFNPGETNDFTICVNFDRSDEKVIVLTNQVAYTNSISVTTKVDYYKFIVSPTAYQATFQLLPQDGNVDLVLHKDFPLPTPVFFDYNSTNLGTNAEQIVLTLTNQPVALSPGEWYLGVYNVDTKPVAYSVLATQLTNAINLIRLTNNIPFDYTAGTGPLITNYFVFTLSDADPGALFDLYNVTGDAELLLQWNELPTTSRFFKETFSSSNYPGSGKLVIRTNETLYPTLQGEWYLAVANQTTNNINFTIRASLLTNSLVITPLTNGVALTNTVPGNMDGSPPEIDYYSFKVSTNAILATFEVAPINGNVDLVLRQGSLPTPATFDYNSASLLANKETLQLQPTSIPVPLSPGEWYLGVYNQQAANASVTYTVRAIEVLSLSTGTNVFIDPEVFRTSSNICLSWPSLVGRTYFVEGKVDSAEPAWTQLSAQITATSTNLSYCIDRPTPYQFFRVVEVLDGRPPPPPPPSTNAFINPTIVSTSSNICLTWPSVVGRSYYAEGKADIADTYWTALSPRIVADDVVSSFCIDRPTPFQFFQVAEISNPAPPPTPPSTNVFINPTLAISATNICLTWESVVGRSYFVEGKAGIADTDWTVLSPTNTATSTTMSHCIDRPTPYQFFQVVELGVPPPPPPSTNVFINPTLEISSTNICLTWESVVGRSYFVEGKAGIADTDWTVLSPTNTATSTTMSHCIDRPTPYQFFQVVELGVPPPPPPSTNVFINPTLEISSTNICLIWESVVGRSYFVEGKAGIADTNWTVLSPTNTATTTTMSQCISRPTSYQFFQVVEVGAISPPPPPPPSTNVFINPTLEVSSTNICLTWESVVGRSYFVEGKAGIADTNWTVLSPTNTATTTTMSQCISRPTSYQFFQVVEVGAISPPPPPPPSTNVFINPTLEISSTNICLTWESVVGREYFIEGKAGIAETNWTVLSPTNTATTTTMSQCIGRPTPYQFFQVVEKGSGGSSAQGPVVIETSNLALSQSGFSLHWTAEVSQRFQVEYATNLPPVWMAFTNTVSSAGRNFTFVDDSARSPGLAGMRFYRIKVVP